MSAPVLFKSKPLALFWGSDFGADFGTDFRELGLAEGWHGGAQAEAGGGGGASAPGADFIRS